jgi:predicted nucleic acid-binding protein
VLVLVDTSVWIDVFRKPLGLDLTGVVELDEVVTCLPVVQEVLQGFRDEKAYQIARHAMLSFPVVEASMTESLFMEAVALYRAARRGGVTVRSSVDCLIAACAMRHDLEVLHDDRDFKALSKVSSLKQRAV